MKSCLPSVFAVLIAGSSALAQPQIGSYSAPVTNPRPVLSPYLNLNRAGTSTAINYYGIVRPQIENHQAIQNLQQQFQNTQGMIQNQTSAQPTEEMTPTGGRQLGGYLNYSHYFPTFSRGSGGSGGATTNTNRR